jgi:DNA-binding phage protein
MTKKKSVSAQGGKYFDEYLAALTAETETRAEFERHLMRVKASAEVVRSLNVARQRRGIALARVAKAMGTKPSAISRLLGGDEANPTLGTLVDISRALGVRMKIDLSLDRHPSSRSSVEVVSHL